MNKKFIMFAAIFCCILTTAVFTSCSKDDDSSNEYYYYRAEGNAYSNSLASMFLIANYTTAIESVVGTQLTQKADDKVIKACDAVYADHKAKYGDSITGYVKIYRKKVGDDNSQTTIKEYNY